MLLFLKVANISIKIFIKVKKAIRPEDVLFKNRAIKITGFRIWNLF